MSQNLSSKCIKIRALLQVTAHQSCNMIAFDSECPLAQMDADRRTRSGWGGHRSRQVDIWVGRWCLHTTQHVVRIKSEMSFARWSAEGRKERADFGIGREHGGRLFRCIAWSYFTHYSPGCLLWGNSLWTNFSVNHMFVGRYSSSIVSGVASQTGQNENHNQTSSW